MRLALSMGEPDLDAFAARITSGQLTEWQAYFAEEPWGEERADLRSGILASTIANWSGKVLREGEKPMTPRDFMPYHRREPERPESLWARITQTFKRMGK